MNQHFVPQAYLRGFADSGDNMYFLNIQNVRKGFAVRPKPVNTAGVCWEQDYYNILNEYADSAFRFEEYPELFVEQEIFPHYERNYQATRDRLISGVEVTTEDILFICDFIVHIKLRNPYWFKTFFVDKGEEMINKAYDSSKKELREHPLYNHLPSEIKDHLVEAHRAMKLTDPYFTKKAFINSLIERRTNAEKNNHATRSAMVDATWTVLEIPSTEDINFITSDNPGYAVSPNGHIDNVKLKGDFVFFFPLTSKACLEISKGVFKQEPFIKDAFAYQKINVISELVEQINLRTSERVNQKILSLRSKELSSISYFFRPGSKV